MITGDQALTACHVAGQVHIVSNPVLILGRSGSGNEYKWVSPDEKEIIPYRCSHIFRTVTLELKHSHVL
jgi:cation-transporting ATPase 13A1